MAKNLLKLSDLHTDEIIAILDRAQMFCQGIDVPNFSDKIACNLFFEPSTRTQYSFNVAEERLGMRVVSFNPASSSLNKNESFYDTVKTFDSFGVDALVIRHSENEYFNQLLGHVWPYYTGHGMGENTMLSFVPKEFRKMFVRSCEWAATGKVEKTLAFDGKVKLI